MFQSIFAPASGQAAKGKGEPEDDEPAERMPEIRFDNDELKKWHEMFKNIDANGDGAIDMEEFRNLVTLGAVERGDPPRTNEWVAEAFNVADRNHDGKIDFEEFVLVNYRHKADMDEYQGRFPPKKSVKEAAAKAKEHVTSLPVLRETLEQAKTSHDPLLASEAARLLKAMGPAIAVGAGTYFATETAQKEIHIHSPTKTKAGARRNYAAMGELAAQGGGNAVDGIMINEEMRAQHNARAAPDQRMSALWETACTVLPSSNDLEILFSFFQFTALTNMLTFSLVERWPELNFPFEIPQILIDWNVYLGWMNIFNIDLQAVAEWAATLGVPAFVESFASLPFPALYLLVTAAIPLIISFVTLILFRPLYKVLWLFILVFGIVLTFSTILAKALLDQTRLQVVGGGTLTPRLLDTMLYVGIGLFAGMIVAYLLWRAFNIYIELRIAQQRLDIVGSAIGKANTTDLKKFIKGEVKEEGPPKPYPVWIYVRNVGVTFLCLLFAAFDNWARPLTIFRFGFALSLMLGLFGVTTAVYNAFSFFEKGRIWLRELHSLIDRTAVSSFLLLLTVLYMPVTRMLFAVWLSKAVECQPGERFPEFANELNSAASQWLATGLVKCEPCDFYDPNDWKTSWEFMFETPAQCSARFCPGEVVFRARNDVRLDYNRMILPFFGPASIITLIGFTVGVPYLYYQIISRHTRLFNKIEIRSSRILTEGQKKQQGDVEWDYRVSGSRNRAKSLYSVFEYQFRYMKLFIVMQKLLIIAIVIFLFDFLFAASIMVCIFHFLVLLFQAWTRPYFDPKSDALAVACSFASAINPLIVVFTFVGVAHRMPQAALGGFIILINFVVPFCALGIGWVCSVRHKKQLQEKSSKIEEGFSEEQKMKIEKARRELDHELDTVTLQYVLLVFAAMAAAAFISIAVLLLGQFWQAATANVVAPTGEGLGNQFAGVPGTAECELEELLKRNEFVGFEGWRDFTTHCCCSDRQNEFSHGEEFEPKQVELWTCSNGLYKERDRSQEHAPTIREFCSPKFNPGFDEPVWLDEKRQFVVKNRNTGDFWISGW